MPKEIRVTWKLDVFEDELSPLEQSLHEEDRALAYAKYVQARYFKDGSMWVFEINIEENTYIVDLETSTVDLKEVEDGNSTNQGNDKR